MKINKLISISFACATILSGSLLISSCKTSSNNVKSKDKSIVILYENDVHCGIDGYAKIAGLRDAMSDTSYVAVVSCGDFLQGGTAGAISKGQYIVDIMKTVGYDAITLGNHEFDYKTDRMKELLDYLKAPITCVNLRDLSTNSFVYAPYVMKQLGKKKVAFVGTVTPTSISTEEYAFFDEKGKQLFELCPTTTYELVQKSVDSARKAGADYVVVLSHLGEDKNTLNVDSHGLIQSTTGIDVVLDGHTHSTIPTETVYNKNGQPVLISQTGTKFVNIGKLFISKDGKKSTQLLPTKDVTLENAKVKQTTDSIKDLSKQLTSRPICKSDVKLVILDDKEKQLVRRAETNAGDLVADAYRSVTGADFAMTNGGGIRTELPAGELTYGDMVGLLPYDNYICVIEITGAQLVDLLKACTQFLPVENGDFPQVSGLKFTINVGKSESITDVQVLDKNSNKYEPLDLNKTYRLATIDYCITGGGFQSKLKQNKIIQPSIILYNDCLIKYVTETLKGHIGSEYANPQGRITINY